MAKAYASALIDAPAETVWAILRDFNGLPNWHSAIVRSEIEDIPDGIYRGEDTMTNDGFAPNAVRIAVTITIHGLNGYGGYVTKSAACEIHAGALDDGWTRKHAKRGGWGDK